MAPVAVTFGVLSEPPLVEVIDTATHKTDVIDSELAEVLVLITIRLCNLSDETECRGRPEVVVWMRLELRVTLTEQKRRVRGLNQLLEHRGGRGTGQTQRCRDRDPDAYRGGELHPVQAEPARDLIKAAGRGTKIAGRRHNKELC